MRIDVLTLFDQMCESVLGESILGRARNNGFITVKCHQIRNYAFDKHKRVDDSPYGGGKGMVMKAEPIVACFEDVCMELGKRPKFIYMSPQGNVLTQKKVIEFSKLSNLVILCGHYEGVDERVIENFIDEEVSIGDYVLTGGELPALVLIDAISRMVPGVLSDEECFTEESHYNGYLEYPQYTKPSVWRGESVPEVLLSGHHANIQKWRLEQSILRTESKRPDMLKNLELEEND